MCRTTAPHEWGALITIPDDCSDSFAQAKPPPPPQQMLTHFIRLISCWVSGELCLRYERASRNFDDTAAAAAARRLSLWGDVRSDCRRHRVQIYIMCVCVCVCVCYHHLPFSARIAHDFSSSARARTDTVVYILCTRARGQSHKHTDAHTHKHTHHICLFVRARYLCVCCVFAPRAYDDDAAYVRYSKLDSSRNPPTSTDCARASSL